MALEDCCELGCAESEWVPSELAHKQLPDQQQAAAAPAGAKAAGSSQAERVLSHKATGTAAGLGPDAQEGVQAVGGWSAGASQAPQGQGRLLLGVAASSSAASQRPAGAQAAPQRPKAGAQKWGCSSELDPECASSSGSPFVFGGSSMHSPQQSVRPSQWGPMQGDACRSTAFSQPISHAACSQGTSLRGLGQGWQADALLEATIGPQIAGVRVPLEQAPWRVGASSCGP